MKTNGIALCGIGAALLVALACGCGGGDAAAQSAEADGGVEPAGCAPAVRACFIALREVVAAVGSTGTAGPGSGGGGINFGGAGHKCVVLPDIITDARSLAESLCPGLPEGCGWLTEP